jgi:carboxypeptidase C (cathepsin A)
MLDKDNMPGHVTAGASYTTHDSMEIRGQQIDYCIDAQEFIFLNEAEEPEASFFAYSILRQNVENPTVRPVMFVYEGGPGAASAEMFLGLFGPRVMKLPMGACVPPTPPYSMEDNPDCLLDICDIVMVDPVGTGFAKLYDESRAAAYAGVEADAAASRKFVSFWLDQHDRWNSPKFLCGKSYGAMRAAVYPYFFLGGAMDPQLGQFGIGINGTILLCDANVADLRDMKNPRLTAPDQPPEIDIIATLAAVNHYHHPEGKEAIREFVEKAHAFAYGAYAHALLMGRALRKEELMETAKKLSYFTGLPVETLLANNLHVSIRSFASMLMAKEGKVVSLYDGRFLRNAADLPPNLYDSSSDDSMLLSLWTAQVTLMHEFLKNTLHVDWNREYLVQNYHIGWNWDFSMSNNARPNDLLTVAANRNPGMHIFMGKGLFDCVTPVGDGRYTISHYDFPEDRLTYREYESGHAIWYGNTRSVLCDDLRFFIETSMRG